MLLCPSAQWGFGVSNVIFPPTWKAEEHIRKQLMSCESSWTDLLCPCPGCLTHLPAHTTTLHLVLASAPPLHTEISKKQQPVLLYSCQTVNSSTNTGQKNTHYFILPSETHKMNFLKKWIILVLHCNLLPSPHPPWVSQQRSPVLLPGSLPKAFSLPTVMQSSNWPLLDPHPAHTPCSSPAFCFSGQSFLKCSTEPQSLQPPPVHRESCYSSEGNKTPTNTPKNTQQYTLPVSVRDGALWDPTFLYSHKFSVHTTNSSHCVLSISDFLEALFLRNRLNSAEIHTQRNF